MPLDPAKLEKWRDLRIIPVGRGDTVTLPRETCDEAAIAVHDLIAEVERLQTELDTAREAARFAGQDYAAAQELLGKAPPIPASSLVGALAWLLARRDEAERQRSLLRKLEWCIERDIPGVGWRDASHREPRVERECPVCGGRKPSSDSHDVRRGHIQPCDLDAALQGKAPPTAAEKLLDLALRGVLDPGGEENFKTFVVALAEWRDRKP